MCVELDLISNITLILLIIGARARLVTGLSLVSNLGGQEVLEHSELIDLELHDEGLFLVEAETSEVGDGSSLVEHIEVAEGELL